MIYAIPNLSFIQNEPQSEQFVPFPYHQYFPHCITELFSMITSSTQHQTEMSDDNSYKHGPIQSLAEDKLERENFVKNLAQGLLNWGSQNETFIVALAGKWGEGKTSVINLVKQELESTNKLIFEFNPASFAEANKIQETFFEELAKFFNVKTSGKYKKTVKKINLYKNLIGGTIKTKNEIQKISNFFLGLGILCAMYPSFSKNLNYIKIDSLVNIAPYFAIVLILLPILEVFIDPFLNYFNFKSESKSTSDVKKEIQNILQDGKNKLIIIIDDIDRLTKSEVRNLLLMIKINADFCNTNYLLSFDRTIIEDLLSKDTEINSRKFLNKIVQHLIELPKSNKITINNYAEEKIKLVIKQYVNSHDRLGLDEQKFRRLIRKGFLTPFETIRDVKRYCNLIKTVIPLHIHGGYLECDLIDILCIEWVKYFEPQLHNDIYMSQGKIQLDDSYKYQHTDYAYVFQEIVKSLLYSGPNSSPSACISNKQSFYKYFILNTTQNLPEYEKSKLLQAQNSESVFKHYNELIVEYPKWSVIEAFEDILINLTEHGKFCVFLSFLLDIDDPEDTSNESAIIKKVINAYIENENFILNSLRCFSNNYYDLELTSKAMYKAIRKTNTNNKHIISDELEKILKQLEQNFIHLNNDAAYYTTFTHLLLHQNNITNETMKGIASNYYKLYKFLHCTTHIFSNYTQDYPPNHRLAALNELFNAKPLEDVIENHLTNYPNMDSKRSIFFTQFLNDFKTLSEQLDQPNSPTK